MKNLCESSIIMGNQELEKVNQFTYLGSLVTRKSNDPRKLDYVLPWSRMFIIIRDSYESMLHDRETGKNFISSTPMVKEIADKLVGYCFNITQLF